MAVNYLLVFYYIFKQKLALDCGEGENGVQILNAPNSEEILLVNEMPFQHIDYYKQISNKANKDQEFMKDFERKKFHVYYLAKEGSFYQGEWLNNKRHGMGVCCWADGSHCKGEWKNDQLNGRVVFVHSRGF